MANTFTKKDLRTGDIVVMRDHELGVVLSENGVIMYQNNGMEYLDNFEDDLLFDRLLEEPQCDIMEVLRGWCFLDPYEGELIFERDDELGFIEKSDHSDEEDKEMAALLSAAEERIKSESLTIIAQAFYGNRTITYIKPESMDRFILGYMTDDVEVTEPIDRTIVRIPGSDCLVLVYSKYKEEKSLGERERLLKEENYERKPLAVIPELDLKLYSRCIGLRMNEDGSFASLERGDDIIICKYLSV